ncbi:MAG: alanine dehydrogenase, partial [Candidatus Acidiferrales bacterium]
STLALTNATFPYVLKLAQHGAREAILRDDGIRDGVNTYEGTLTCEAVAKSQNKSWKPVRDILSRELIA